MVETAFLPQPRGLTFLRWARLVTEQLQPYNVPAPIDEAGWKSWAAQLANVPDLVAAEFPNPYGFTNWERWAERWLQTVG